MATREPNKTCTHCGTEFKPRQNRANLNCSIECRRANPRHTPLNPNRFWSKVLKTDTCWLWQAQLNNKGYGVFTYHTTLAGRKSKQMYAHRVSWTLKNGPIPDAMRVLHHCDNPQCCNPDHLFLGTQAENMRDCSNKGRASKGGDNAKVTPDQVRAIRADARKHHIIAADYGVGRLAIWMIKHRRTWAEIE